MKKNKIIIAILAFLTCLTFTSCWTEVSAMDSTDDIYTTQVYSDNVETNIDIVIHYGSPYYYNGVLEYYLYRGIYYYPFWYDDLWYWRPFYRPFVHGYWFYSSRDLFRPRHGDWVMRPGHYGFGRPNGRFGGRPRHGDCNGYGRPMNNHRPTNGSFGNGGSRNHSFNRPNNNGGTYHPNNSSTRTTITPRPNTRTFGGTRNTTPNRTFSRPSTNIMQRGTMSVPSNRSFGGGSISRPSGSFGGSSRGGAVNRGSFGGHR